MLDHKSTSSNYLWGSQAKIAYLMIIAAILLLVFLGARGLWTQEHRWAEIVYGMFFHQDYLHPYLGSVNYYDKPLLSYWLIIIASYLTGGLTTFALRLPSALAGLLALWSLFKIGCCLRDRCLGFIAAWLLLTTFYFVFWARTASADMLNVGGILFAIAWYFNKRDQANFVNFLVFFTIVALSALCKGLVSVAVTLIALLPDLLNDWHIKRYLKPSLLFAFIIGFLIYLTPFLLSSYIGNGNYHENGLYEVWRENIVRYFAPFDHKGPIYTYFIYLPIYLLPWTFFFVAALFTIKSRWHHMDAGSRWICWSLLLVFMFFTLSHSRRSYYVLPIVPFALLFLADWIYYGYRQGQLIAKCAKIIVMAFVVILIVNFNILQPLFYSGGGPNRFATKLEQVASLSHPLSDWRFVTIDARRRINFYLKIPPNTPNCTISGSDRNHITTISRLLRHCPMLAVKNRDVIILSRYQYLALLKKRYRHYILITTPPTLAERLFGLDKSSDTIALIPPQR